MQKPKNEYYRVLTIAGSDSGGGAGIQADLKTFAALGCYGMTAITALTAQNTQKVSGIFEVPPEFIAKQIDAVIEDMGVDVVKIGMLLNAGVIATVAGRLQAHGIENIVLDPVMISTSGDHLLKEEAIAVLKQRLIPLARMITPNLREAEMLYGKTIGDKKHMQHAAVDLGQLGAKSVLIKGGHFDSDVSADYLFIPGLQEGKWFEAKRIDTANTHGTGCSLSSAIAAYLARGFTLMEAVREAKHFITQAIEEGKDYRLGKGSGPIFHFWQHWRKV